MFFCCVSLLIKVHSGLHYAVNFPFGMLATMTYFVSDILYNFCKLILNTLLRKLFLQPVWLLIMNECRDTCRSIIYIKYISRKNLHKSQNAIIPGVHDSHIFLYGKPEYIKQHRHLKGTFQKLYNCSIYSICLSHSI